MSVYKEGYHAVELIQKQSKQIWPDACDFGAPTKEGDEVWNWAKQLTEWYGIKKTRTFHSFSHGTKQVSMIVSLMNEWKYSDDMDNGKRVNEDDYTEYFRVTYYKTKNEQFDGFFEVEKVTNPKLISKYKADMEEQMNLTA